jgi:hypothetical protein
LEFEACIRSNWVQGNRYSKPQRAAVAVNALKWKRLRAIRNYLSSTVLSKVESVDESVDRKST